MHCLTKKLTAVLALLSFLLAAAPSLAQYPYTGVIVEEVPIPAAVAATIQTAAGFTQAPRTYRVYVCIDEPNWAVLNLLSSQVGGVLLSTFEVSCPTCPGTQFFQEPLFGDLVGAEVNSFAFDFVPAAEYDSWWNIGPPYLFNVTPLSNDPSIEAAFEAGGAFYADDGFETIFGANLAGFACPYTSNADGRVLVGQFTTEGVLEGNFGMAIAPRNPDANCSPQTPVSLIDIYNVFFTNDFVYSFGDATCLNMPGCVNFGACTELMGAAKVNGLCVEVSGCGWEAFGVDYSPFSFASLEECIASTSFGDGPCYELPTCIDFGDCPGSIGYTWVGNGCFEMTGCGTTVGGINYSPFFYSSLDECIVGCSEILLPVDLLTFTATPDNDQVRLRWVTASETNSQEYIIERSRDMVSWTHVANHVAAGQSNQQIVYTARDLHPLNGLSYYRLRQIDFNGEEALNEVRSVRFTAKGPVPYPNPARENLRFSGDMSDITTIRVSDYHGKVILNRALNVEATTELNISALAMGSYIIELTTISGEVFRHKFQKM